MSRLIGQVAIVTGASRGIGRGIAKVLVDEGARVYITGRNKQFSEDFPTVMETAEQLNKLGSGTCIGVYCDHSDDTQTSSLFQMIEEKEGRLDILVNNAFSSFDVIMRLI
ncbi:Dehydrogenase/reductase SDR family member 1 [Thelohanellus kitauei]|uniref:Dehydrogenase/reductase SDR family member 1 n=1 Tax=Thelohanellus kitauei TaxID=669202 RepID=A0A0C2JG98_THEKT|nr:Dehydrogenase/reductase SDR family member 1 [Thelohanellus kitauei]